MDKMREEFEEWISHYIGESWLKPDTSRAGEYFDNNTQSMWESWQASRSALCVELPTKMRDEVLSLYDIGFNDGIDGAMECIEDAGVSYK